jgi:hypothetical protein
LKWRALTVVATPGRDRGKERGARENRGGRRGVQEPYAERVLRGLTRSARIQR